MSKILIDKHTSVFEAIESSKKPGVLATIRGAVTGWKPNRNGRTYSKELWKKAIESEFVSEQVALKHFIGEADHPEDRLDPAFEHMSHAVCDFEFRDDKQEVWATIDILDTPDGHKLKTLLDYSGSLSFSTRGSGDVLENGEVDPDTYQLFAIDSVIRPSYPTATVLVESETLNKRSPITESEALKILEAYSGNKMKKEESGFDLTDSLFLLNNRRLAKNLCESASDYSHDDLLMVMGYVDEFYNGHNMDDEEVYNEVKSKLKGTKFEDNDYLVWDAMAAVIDNSDQDDDFFNENELEDKSEPLKEDGNPKLCDAIESTLIIWFEDNTEDILDRTVTCEANKEGFSYVITVKSSYFGRYNMLDDYDVMDYAGPAGKYIADKLKIEYIKSEKVNDRTFKIYLDNYYTN